MLPGQALFLCPASGPWCKVCRGSYRRSLSGLLLGGRGQPSARGARIGQQSSQAALIPCHAALSVATILRSGTPGSLLVAISLGARLSSSGAACSPQRSRPPQRSGHRQNLQAALDPRSAAPSAAAM
ncbi:hypothetical protein NDU88_002946 [Pleurodeles waltl]|uniref:Uncharacterized protein n=1 Tax=Pleurodeles waltl TaxID=8319 RepID=A0AAV7VCS8_PLEWA|nr:hypothetical protein NDU88_002946 [Pleurodeles waltl]